MSQLFSFEERAYVLGLFVAGGTITDYSFSIEMPFNQWGIDALDQAAIAQSLLTHTRKTFKDAYGIEINFQIAKKNCWKLVPVPDVINPSKLTDAIAQVRNDLVRLGLPSIGPLLKSAELEKCRKILSQAAAKRFLSGIFDARASLTVSHRRFDLVNPMVSIEVPGSSMNYQFVVQLCSWMTDLGSSTDQVIYNHPSLHASDDPTYEGWRKGFKIRIAGKSFFENHSFGITPKGFDVSSLAVKQEAKVQQDCNAREIRCGDRSLHSEIGDENLPEEVRGKVFLHYLHICAAFGCPHAPIQSVQVAVNNYKHYVSALPICSKGTVDQMSALFDRIKAQIFPNAEEIDSSFSIDEVLERVEKINYPEIEGSVKFLAAESLNGKRFRGNGAEIIANSGDLLIKVRTLTSQQTGFNPPILLMREELDRAAIISSINGKANSDALHGFVKLNGMQIEVDQSVRKIYNDAP